MQNQERLLLTLLQKLTRNRPLPVSQNRMSGFLRQNPSLSMEGWRTKSGSEMIFDPYRRRFKAAMNGLPGGSSDPPGFYFSTRQSD
ncbi:hypothetical protein [Rhizobium sp. X9]|uniref:hypothetical protein n=1 Tax=Rhizobium sp. X9 TaxID=2815360 RepID=UPI001C0B1EAE|nr:hypothetical protein [Rhizobium sp. X9]